MKKVWKSLASMMLAAVMVITTVMTYLPSLEILAAPITKQMAHLKAGSGNGNGHFGGTTPEAFVLSDRADVTNDNFSFTLKVGSTQAETRFRFVNKYVDDNNWSFIAYDGASGWLYQYKVDGMEAWPNLTGLPPLNQNDVVEVSGSYGADGLSIIVNNTTTKQSGTATANNETFMSLAVQGGQIGFGAGTFGTQYTDIYFSDVIVGETEYETYSAWSLYRDGLTGQTWEPSVPVVVGDDGTEDPEPSTEGRKWITVQGGSNNGGGHAYGNGNVTAPALLLDNTRKMPVDGTLSLTLRPVTSQNWGVFYTYQDDNNWLYVGYDTSSHWYYQYNLNGSGAYASISGLPEPVVGQEMAIMLTLSREQLAVTVNGTRVSQSVPNLLTLAEKIAGNGRFGVKTNGATKVEFADMEVDGTYCMDDEWVWCADRNGQITETYNTPVERVSGRVTNSSNEAIEGVTVRFGVNSTITDGDGNYVFEGLEVGEYNVAATAPGYQAYENTETVAENADNVFNIQLTEKAPINLEDYDSIASDYMTVYVGKEFPVVARYVLKDENETIFRAQETQLSEIEINGTSITPTDITANVSDSGDSKSYAMTLKDEGANIDLSMTVVISVDDNDLTWEVTELTKNEGCADISSIDIPQLNLVSVDAVETDAVFNGAKASNSTVSSGDREITWSDGFNPSTTDGYLYAFLTNGSLSAGLWSNSEIEGDQRVILNSGADTMSLTSAMWYYEDGDENAQKRSSYDYPVSELPCAKVCIAGNINGDDELDWNDGALAFRDIMNIPQGAEAIKELVNYRIVMNFASMVSNPYLTTADNIKKVYLATDGLPQAVMLKGYGSEGHDSANSEYAHISEREGGVEDFRSLISIAHDYNTEIGVHINAQEAYPESKSFNNTMVSNGASNGWGWLDQSYVIDKLWDLGSEARYKRLVQFYDRINGTDFYSGDWDAGEYVKESEGTLNATMEEISKDAATRDDNMDFIYLDVWYQDSWETRRIAEQINSLGWRFSTEFPYEGEYDSTWSHWATDAAYGGNTTKGYNSEIIRFIRNDQRDVQVINYPSFGGAADNPLLGGYRLYGFEGWGGDQDFNKYIRETFTENLPTKFLQHYYVTDWEDYADGESPVGNQEKQITLKNDENDTVVVTRNEQQRSDSYIERTITLNGKKVLDDVEYLLPWPDSETGEEKLYHWNLEGGTTTWELQDDWAGLANVIVYELSDQGRGEGLTVPVNGGSIELTAEPETAYVVVKGESAKTLKADFGEADHVVDPGFNGYAGTGDALDEADWIGAIDDPSVVVEKASTGDQRLAFNSPSKDVAVTTQISGLKTGVEYVAEVYVDNESDSRAEIAVNTGSGSVSNYTMRSIAPNYVKSDQKHSTNMQRMQVSFTAEGPTASLTLFREAGVGSTYMDDIRIVEITLNNYDENGNFTQDFESVVQGLYPFVLGPAQGVSDPVTHLSELNAPYTQAGWQNKKATDDVIEGEWSVKHHGKNTGIIYQTIPQNFRFEAGKVYTVEFDYQSGPDKAYAMVIGDGTTYTLPTEEQYLEQKTGGGEANTGHVTMQVVGSGSGQTWIGLYENGSRANGAIETGEKDFILDNLRITVDEDAVAALIESTSLFVGETAAVTGSNLDQITWTNTDDSVAVLDKDMTVSALKAGTTTLTAAYPDGTSDEFVIIVSDSVQTEIPAEELGSFTANANTEETASESAGASQAVDGNPSTFWHSSYSGGQFVVSSANPAILTVDLGQDTQIGGFRFQQRPSANNGIVQQFSYRILDANKNPLAEGDSTEVPAGSRTGGAWITAVLADNVEGARYIEISVEQGQGNFAAIAEVVPIRVQNVATGVVLPQEMSIGEGQTSALTATPDPEGTILKGLVWSSSDAETVYVDSYGNVTGLKAGSAVITVSNAAGLKASCTVTVTAGENPPAGDITAPTAPADLKATNVTSSSITVTWAASSDDTGVAGYEIFVNGISAGRVTGREAVIGNLKADTQYEITVKAYDAAGNVSVAVSITARTAAAAPGNAQQPGSGTAGGTVSGNPTVTAVQTGDESPIAVFVIAAAAAATVAAAVIMRQPRRRTVRGKRRPRNSEKP